MLVLSPGMSSAQTEPDPSPPVETADPTPSITPDPPLEEPSVAIPPTDLTIRRLTWDILGGGIQEGVGVLQAELGFSALPRVAYHQSISSKMSLGGLVALDYARWAPDAAFTTSLVAAGTVRYSLLHNEEWTIGLRGEPGIRIGLD
ncbi:MAG: hypothetical protein AAFV29_06770, partial [Myxococcota bacterium]